MSSGADETIRHSNRKFNKPNSVNSAEVLSMSGACLTSVDIHQCPHYLFLPLILEYHGWRGKIKKSGGHNCVQEKGVRLKFKSKVTLCLFISWQKITLHVFQGFPYCNGPTYNINSIMSFFFFQIADFNK